MPWRAVAGNRFRDPLLRWDSDEGPRSAPPFAPALGLAYIVGASATGAWAGKSQCVAAWTTGGWRFLNPVEGMAFYERARGTFVTYRNGAWETGTIRATAVQIGGSQVLGGRRPAIAAPTGGSVVDVEARAAISAMLAALRAHGLIEP